MTLWIPTAMLCACILLAAWAYIDHRRRIEGSERVRRELEDILARQKPQWSRE